MESNKKEESLMESGLANRHGKVGVVEDDQGYVVDEDEDTSLRENGDVDVAEVVEVNLHRHIQQQENQ